MTDAIEHVPTAAIDADALVRDRAELDPEAQAELRRSIAATGMRLPVEIFELAEPEGEIRYGLISGYRRLVAVRSLFELTGQERYATVAAIRRMPRDLGAALAGMVEENEVRAELSPLERGRTAVAARDQGVFPTIEEAVERLYPAATRYKRSRLRTLARVVDELHDVLAEPEAFTMRQCLRIATALQAGFGHEIRTLLAETGARDADTQWSAIAPLLAEAEQAPAETLRRARRARRHVKLRPGLTVRREVIRDGYVLRFTGRDVTEPLMDAVSDEIERLFASD